MKAILLALVVVIAPLVGVVGATTTAPADLTENGLRELGLSDTGSDVSSQADNDTNESNATFGTAISSFMQASSATTADEVDNGMFTASFESTNPKNRDKLVEKRITQLEKRQNRLEEQREELLAAEELNVSQRAKAAHLQARITSLQRAIETASVAAERAGVDQSRLNTLRQNARDLSGPEVSRIATGLNSSPGRTDGASGPQVDVPDANSTNVTDGDSPGKSDEAPGQNKDDGSEENVTEEVTDVSTETITTETTTTETTTGNTSANDSQRTSTTS